VRRARLLLIVMALFAAAFAARAAQPLVRVSVQAKQPVLVGQQVKISVTVLAPNYFTSAPPWPPLKVDGAIVTMPDESSQHAVEQIGGATYAGIQKTYVFSAQQEGEFHLPPVKIAFKYGGDDGKPRQGSVTLPPTKIVAKLPAGASAGGATTPVARVTITQRFDHVAKDGRIELNAGDALVRTVHAFAAQTQAMMIPPPTFEAPAGVRVFESDPQLEDETRQKVGFIGGHRTDRVSYVFEKPGRYTLPAVDIGWFDAKAGKPQTAEAPAVTVVVAEATAQRRGAAIAPEAASAASTAATGPRWHVDVWRLTRLVAGVLLPLVVIAWLARRYLPRWISAWGTRRAARATSDAVMFATVIAACRRNDAPSAQRRLLDWSRRHVGATPRAWCARLGDTALAAELDALDRVLYAGDASGSEWHGAALATALRAAHAKLATRARRAGMLPPLNPMSVGATSQT